MISVRVLIVILDEARISFFLFFIFIFIFLSNVGKWCLGVDLLEICQLLPNFLELPV
jgi:hypothetical protein